MRRRRGRPTRRVSELIERRQERYAQIVVGFEEPCARSVAIAAYGAKAETAFEHDERAKERKPL